MDKSIYKDNLIESLKAYQRIYFTGCLFLIAFIAFAAETNNKGVILTSSSLSIFGLKLLSESAVTFTMLGYIFSGFALLYINNIRLRIEEKLDRNINTALNTYPSFANSHILIRILATFVLVHIVYKSFLFITPKTGDINAAISAMTLSLGYIGAILLDMHRTYKQKYKKIPIYLNAKLKEEIKRSLK